VKKYCENILVVNDGSTDQTEELLSSRKGIQVISYKKIQEKVTLSERDFIAPLNWVSIMPLPLMLTGSILLMT
jgi:hypothetical protein